jgi:diadenosine tetraphosphate (Ap4A) HIT family hydrolase
MTERSPFLAVPARERLAENRSGFAIADAFPVSPGHALVVPFRPIATWWDAELAEQHDLVDLVAVVKRLLDERHRPDGSNVGFNDGPAAGQTVGHLHLHVIPRYAGDVADPRGGVRHVIPAKGNYLAPPPARLLDASSSQARMKLELLRALIADDLDRVDLVVSFIMRSGLDIVLPRLADAVQRGARVRVLTTDYLDVTDPDALATLLDLSESADEMPGTVDVKVWQEPGRSFHPKAYLFRSSTSGRAVGFVGS